MQHPSIRTLTGAQPTTRLDPATTALIAIDFQNEYFDGRMPIPDGLPALRQARRLIDLDVPLLGVNFGKVGFLAEFTVEDVQRHWDSIAAGKCRISQFKKLTSRLCPGPSSVRTFALKCL